MVFILKSVIVTFAYLNNTFIWATKYYIWGFIDETNGINI